MARWCHAAVMLLALLFAETTAGYAAAKLGHGLVLRREHGTEGFEYLFHEPSGKWVGRECQVRILDDRRLPDPLGLTGPSPAISIQLFGPLTVESAPITGGIQNVQRFERYRWWWLNIPMGDDVLKSLQRLGIQVAWPPAGDGSRSVDPMEIFILPPIDTAPPETWTAWKGPDSLRAGESAWHAEAHRRAPRGPAPTGPLPTFEVRCRAGLWDTIYRRTR
jgi:hypothetical protein